MTEKIKIVMVKRGMSGVDLAARLKITPSTLYIKFKKDKYSVHDLEKIANALDCKFEGNLVLNDTGEKV